MNKRIILVITIIILFIVSILTLKQFSPYERIKKVVDSLSDATIMEVNKLSSEGDFKYETVKIIDDKNIIEDIGFPGIVINNIIVKISKEDMQKIYQYID